MLTEQIQTKINRSTFSKEMVQWGIEVLGLNSQENVTNLQLLEDIVDLRNKILAPYQSSPNSIMFSAFLKKSFDFINHLTDVAEEAGYESLTEYLIKEKNYSYKDLDRSLKWLDSLKSHETEAIFPNSTVPLFLTFNAWLTELVEEILLSFAFFRFGASGLKNYAFDVVFRSQAYAEMQSRPEDERLLLLVSIN